MPPLPWMRPGCQARLFSNTMFANAQCELPLKALVQQFFQFPLKGSGAYVEGCFVITLLLSKNGGDYLDSWIPAQGYTQAGNFQLGPQNWQFSHKVWQQLGNKEAIEICAHDILYLQWTIFNLTFSHKVFLHVTIFIAPYGGAAKLCEFLKTLLWKMAWYRAKHYHKFYNSWIFWELKFYSRIIWSLSTI